MENGDTYFDELEGSFYGVLGPNLTMSESVRTEIGQQTVRHDGDDICACKSTQEFLALTCKHRCCKSLWKDQQ